MNKLKIKRILLAVMALMGFSGLRADVNHRQTGHGPVHRKDYYENVHGPAAAMNSNDFPEKPSVPDQVPMDHEAMQPWMDAIAEDPHMNLQDQSGFDWFNNAEQNALLEYQSHYQLAHKLQEAMHDHHETGPGLVIPPKHDQEVQDLYQGFGHVDSTHGMNYQFEDDEWAEEDAEDAVQEQIHNAQALKEWKVFIDEELKNNPDAMAHDLLKDLADYDNPAFKKELHDYVNEQKHSAKDTQDLDNAVNKAIVAYDPTLQQMAELDADFVHVDAKDAPHAQADKAAEKTFKQEMLEVAKKHFNKEAAIQAEKAKIFAQRKAQQKFQDFVNWATGSKKVRQQPHSHGSYPAIQGGQQIAIEDKHHGAIVPFSEIEEAD